MTAHKKLKYELVGKMWELGFLTPKPDEMSLLDLQNFFKAREEGCPMWAPRKRAVRDAGRYYFAANKLVRRTGRWSKRCLVTTSALSNTVEALAFSKQQEHFFLEGKNVQDRDFIGACLSVLCLETHDAMFFKRTKHKEKDVPAVRLKGPAAFDKKCDEMAWIMKRGIQKLSVMILHHEKRSRTALDRINLIASELRDGVKAMKEKECAQEVYAGWCQEENYLNDVLAGNRTLNPKDLIGVKIYDRNAIPRGGLKYSFETDLTKDEVSTEIMSELNSGRNRPYNPEIIQTRVQAAPTIPETNFTAIIVEFGKRAALAHSNRVPVPFEVVQDFVKAVGAKIGTNGDLILPNGSIGLRSGLIEKPPNVFVTQQAKPPPASRLMNPIYADSNLLATEKILENGLSAKEAPTHMMEDNAVNVYKKSVQEKIDADFYLEVGCDAAISLNAHGDGLDFNLLRGDMLLPTLKQYMEWQRGSIVAKYLSEGSSNHSYLRMKRFFPELKPNYITAKLVEMLNRYVTTESALTLFGPAYLRACYHCAKFWSVEYKKHLDGEDDYDQEVDLGSASLYNAINRFAIITGDNSPFMTLLYAGGTGADYERVASFIAENNIRLAIQNPEITDAISKASFAGGVPRAREEDVNLGLAENIAHFKLVGALISGQRERCHKAITENSNWENLPLAELNKQLKGYATRHTRNWSAVDTNIGHLIGVATMMDQMNISDFNKLEAVTWAKSLFEADECGFELLDPNVFTREAKKIVEERVSACVSMLTKRNEAMYALPKIIEAMNLFADNEANHRNLIERHDSLKLVINKIFLIVAANMDDWCRSMIESIFPSLALKVKGFAYLELGTFGMHLNADVVRLLKGAKENLEKKLFIMK